MQNELSAPFYTGAHESAYPLGRYLPPLSPGCTSAWLRANLPTNSWLLEPFGSHPGLAIEAAQAGHRVLVASNNPILSLMLEVLAAAPDPADFQAVLAELAASRRGSESLESIIEAMYTSPCPGCNQNTQVLAYLWRPAESQPYARLIHCKTCGGDGEYPLNSIDIDNLRLPGSAALSQARALERITTGEEESREVIQKALEVYPTRPLYILSTLINKAQGLDLSPQNQQRLFALLLNICDEGNTLWPWPNSRLRPRQLTLPPQYRENNLWLALENAVTQWGNVYHTPVPLTHWPDLPPASGGICIYPGRIRALFPLSQEIQFQGIIARIPRPNQAFWTLSAIWSGWLWGRDAVQPLKSALERRRYDWTWHLDALQRTLSLLNQSLPAGVPFFAALPEVNAGFLSAALGAGQLAGFTLSGFSLRRDEEEAQVTWKTGVPISNHPEHSPLDSARTAMLVYLQERGEPSAYLQMYAASWLGLTNGGHIPTGLEHTPADLIVEKQAIIHKALSDPRSFQRLGPPSTTFETGWWDLADPVRSSFPLADRIEINLVRSLQNHGTAPQAELEDEMCARFPGLLTPPLDFMLACLQSYARVEPGEPPRWTLQDQETPTMRSRQIQAVQKLLIQVGEQMGFTCISLPQPSEAEIKPPLNLLWKSSSGQTIYAFYLMASSLISRCIHAPIPAQQQVIVLPGSRASLLSFKLQRDPVLAKNATGWHFLKFRHLRQLAEQPLLSPALWAQLLDVDPPRWEEATQMTFF